MSGAELISCLEKRWESIQEVSFYHLSFIIYHLSFIIIIIIFPKVKTVEHETDSYYSFNSSILSKILLNLFSSGPSLISLRNQQDGCKLFYHEEGGFLGKLLLGGDVVADVAQLLLHYPNSFEI